MAKLKWIAVTCIVLISTINALGNESSQLIAHLKAGTPQTIVTYGTSLTGPWVSQVQQVLQAQYPGLVTVINSAQGGMWSKWGVEHLDERVIAKKPDVVFIEFAVNDAYLPYKTSVAEARSNLINMIDRILAAKADTEIILMTMDPTLLNRPQIRDYYQMYRDVAKERKLLLIDNDANWESILKNNKELFVQYVPDGIHPTADACQKVVTPEIIEALGIKAPATTSPSAK